ncbi:MAG: PAS domain S-box protein [Planctomycetota bacterium]
MASESPYSLERFDHECGRIFEEAINEIYLFDVHDRRFIRVNRRARDNLGYSLAELQKRTPRDLLANSDATRFESTLQSLLNREVESVYVDTRYRRKDGTTYGVEGRLQLTEFGGQPAFVAVLLDTTDRVRAAGALSLREQAIDAATLGIVITDPTLADNPIVYCNRAFEKITGYAAAEVIGRNCRFLQAGERAQPGLNRIRIAIREGRHYRTVLRNFRKDGTPFWNELTISPVRDATNRVTNFIGVVHDITAQRAAEADVLDNEARLAAIFDAAVEAIITINEQGICESANPAAEAMFGYQADELVGQNVSVLMPAPHRQAHDGYLANYLQTGEKKIIGVGREVVGQRRDGSQFPLHLSVSEVMLGERRIFTGIMQDLSQRKEYERRLVQSERLAALGEAMASVAHESRNLLQKIQIGVELCRSRAADADGLVTQLDKIEAASDGLRALLEEVREYAAPLTITNARPHPLGKLLTEAWDQACASYPAIQSNLRLPKSTDITLQVDQSRMVQVFRNLFENSLAACPEPVELAIGVTQTHSSQDEMVAITVADNGPGLDREQQERVFEPFYTTKSKGTGLGMAIARKIVQAHGGELSVAQADASGAHFCITLPR